MFPGDQILGVRGMANFARSEIRYRHRDSPDETSFGTNDATNTELFEDPLLLPRNDHRQKILPNNPGTLSGA